MQPHIISGPCWDKIVKLICQCQLSPVTVNVNTKMWQQYTTNTLTLLRYCYFLRFRNSNLYCFPTNLAFAAYKKTLRIDNTRQSVICTTLHYSVVMCCRASYYIPNESLYFCLSNHINEIMIKLIFQKLWILNQFFNFYFLNMDISLNNYTPVIKFWGGALNIAFEGTVSQNFD